MGVVNDGAFIFDTFILFDKLIVSFTLLITRLLSVFEYSAPDAIAEIVQELFVLVIEIFVPAIRVILSCLLLDNESKQVLRFTFFVFCERIIRHYSNSN